MLQKLLGLSPLWDQYHFLNKKRQRNILTHLHRHLLRAREGEVDFACKCLRLLTNLGKVEDVWRMCLSLCLCVSVSVSVEDVSADQPVEGGGCDKPTNKHTSSFVLSITNSLLQSAVHDLSDGCFCSPNACPFVFFDTWLYCDWLRKIQTRQ